MTINPMRRDTIPSPASSSVALEPEQAIFANSGRVAKGVAIYMAVRKGVGLLWEIGMRGSMAYARRRPLPNDGQCVL